MNHIDTAQFYGPRVANELLREALAPYPADLVIVSKVGAARDEQGNGTEPNVRINSEPASTENLATLGMEQIPVVNLRRHPDTDVPLPDQMGVMEAMRNEGLIGSIGLSNIDLEQYETAKSLIDIACVQNPYNLADTSGQDVFDACRTDEVPFVPFFPLGSAFNPAQPVLRAPAVEAAAQRLKATTAQVALAWLLQRAPNVLLIPGTSSLEHLEENLAADKLVLDQQALDELP